jgi:hypothetical protein
VLVRFLELVQMGRVVVVPNIAGPLEILILAPETRLNSSGDLAHYKPRMSEGFCDGINFRGTRRGNVAVSAPIRS